MKQLSAEENSNTGMIQMDFVENFTCFYQDEVVRAHWKTNSVTIFTVTIWFQKVFLLHETITVSCNSMMMRGQLFHVRLLLLIVGKKCSEKIYKTLKFSWIAHLVNLKINFIFIYIGHNLPQLFPHYHVTWNYSATIHAKGDASGLGGTLVALLGLLCRTVGLTGIRIPS